MRQFIRDNLLTKNSNLKHDDCFATEDETLSPTAERLVVLRWLDLLHSPLPNHIANVFSHELQNHSLKDIQLLVVTQINSLLNDVIQKEDNVTEKVSHSFEAIVAKDLILENTVPLKE